MKMTTTMLSSCFIIVLICCVSISGGDTNSTLVKEKEILDNILNSTLYDLRVRPEEILDIRSPTRVRVNMYIKMISRIDDVRMQYNAQIILRQKWVDKRLSFNNLNGNLQTINLFEEKIWTPDLFIANERSGYVNNILKPNRYIRIYPDGSVLYSARVSLVLSCPMDFRFFPFDTQVCWISVESYGFTSEDVCYEWDGADPVGMPDDFEFAYYAMHKHTTSTSNLTLSSGNYSSLRVNFYLKRKLTYHLIHLFLPSMMLVITSWITFWLDHQIVMTRLFVVLTTLLVLSYKVSDFNASLTPVSYTKSVDIWTGTCLAFIFAAMIEVVVVDYRWRQQQKKQRRSQGGLETTDVENIAFSPLEPNSNNSATDIHVRSTEGGRLRNYYYRLAPNLPAMSKKLDVWSRYLFPICFTVFNVLYWLVNLTYYVV